MEAIKKILEKISKSTEDHKGKISSSRIASYFILISILLSSLSFLTIDTINSIAAWKSGNLYVIPASHIAIFGMILTHHLVLLGIKINGEKGIVNTGVDDNIETREIEEKSQAVD